MTTIIQQSALEIVCIEVNVATGTRSYEVAIEQAIAMAQSITPDICYSPCPTVKFTYNEEWVIVAHDSDPVLIARDMYRRGILGTIDDKVVGPYPDPMLSAAATHADTVACTERWLKYH